MQPNKTSVRGPEGVPSRSAVFLFLLTMIVVILFAVLLKNKAQPSSGSIGSNGTWAASAAMVSHSREPVRVGGASSHRGAAFGQQTPQEIVADKIMKFGKNRREVAHAMARRLNVKV